MARPNPKYDPVTGTVTTPTTPKEPRPNPRYGAATSFIKKGGVVESVYDFLQGFNIENPTGQQESYLKNLPTSLISPDYDKSKLDQFTIQSLSELGIKPSTSLADARSRINKFNNKMIQKADLSLIDDSLTNTELNQVKKEIEDLKIKGQEYKSNKQAWANFLLPSAFAEPELSNQITHVEPGSLSLLSANIKISFNILGIGGFSTSIPIDDIGELQALSNSAPEWKYTLIDNSTNPPLTTLNELIITINDLLPNITITDNMVTQQVINFNIVDGRAVGSIKFIATNNFNPYYYNKNIVNIIQIKDPNGAEILDVVKENRLRFTETERDEVINYDEDVKQNTRATVQSFVLSSATAPRAFSKMASWNISETETPKPITSGFMGAGIVGAIAGLILIGFIADHRRGK